jgi:hypothetical protein
LTLGSPKNAKEIFEFYHSTKDDEAVPSGWEFIGSGVTRSAYLGPDGIVYKVAHSWPVWNITEAKWMKLLRNAPDLVPLGVTTPHTTLWKTRQINKEQHNVLAMDYIAKTQEVECAYDHFDTLPKRCNCKPEGRMCFGLLLQHLYESGIEDMFPENVHYAADGKFYLIDLGAQ